MAPDMEVLSEMETESRWVSLACWQIQAKG
jgi:hypothetical protein